MIAPTERQILQMQETIQSEKDKSQGLMEMYKQLQAENEQRKIQVAALSKRVKELRAENERLKEVLKNYRSCPQRFEEKT